MSPESSHSDDPKTLLLVDDQEPTRQAMAEVLRREGYRILQASDTEAAGETLRTVRVDLVIVDQMPPRMAGWRLLEDLERDALDVPVIVVSDCLPQEKKEVPARAPAGLLTKPIRLDDLLGLVRRTLFPPPPRPGQRILVVDDAEDMRLLLSRRRRISSSSKTRFFVATLLRMTTRQIFFDSPVAQTRDDACRTTPVSMTPRWRSSGTSAARNFWSN